MSRQFKWFSKVLIYSGFMFLFTDCGSFFRKMPIQVSRTVQMDFYRQYYNFNGDAKLAVKVAENLLGKENYDSFSNIYNFKEDEQFLEAVEDGKIYVQGALTLTIYLDPTDHNTFILDGIGRYAFVCKGEVPFTADFHIKNEQFSVEELLNKTSEPILLISITQIPIRHFELVNEYSGADKGSALPLTFHIELERHPEIEEVFSLRYAEGGRPYQHEVKYDGQPIGFLEFESFENSSKKLIDLRGRNFLKNDY